MSPFIKKSLAQPDRVCLRLKDLRLKQGLSLDEMAAKTKIQRHYLVAIEECNFDQLPSGNLYRKQFIRRYAQTLGVPSDPLVRQFMFEEADPETKVDPQKSTTNLSRSNLPNLIQRLGIALVALGLMFYLGNEVFAMVAPPTLIITSPADAIMVENSSIVIQGRSEPEVMILVNGRPIENQSSGNFSTTLNLVSGVNTIVVTAQKKHGQTTTRTIHLTAKISS